MLVTIASPCKITAFYCLCWEWFCLWFLRCGKELWSNCTPVSCKRHSNFVFLKALWKPTTHYSTSRLFSYRSCCSMALADLFPCTPGVPVFKLHTCERSTGWNRVHFKVEGLAKLNKPCASFCETDGEKKTKDLRFNYFLLGCRVFSNSIWIIQLMSTFLCSPFIWPFSLQIRLQQFISLNTEYSI